MVFCQFFILFANSKNKSVREKLFSLKVFYLQRSNGA